MSEIDVVTGASQMLDNVIASVECKIVEVVERGDHSLFIGEVVEARFVEQPDGGPDDAILEMKELGDNVFYGD